VGVVKKVAPSICRRKGVKMGRDVMDDRKRALVMGKFKFLYQVRGSGGI
jgi:hypothetical protein